MDTTPRIRLRTPTPLARCAGAASSWSSSSSITSCTSRAAWSASSPVSSETCPSITTSSPASRYGTCRCSIPSPWPACACTSITASGASSRLSAGTTPGAHRRSEHFRDSLHWSCLPASSPSPLPCWPGGCAEGDCDAEHTRREDPFGTDRTEVGPQPLRDEAGEPRQPAQAHRDDRRLGPGRGRRRRYARRAGLPRAVLLLSRHAAPRPLDRRPGRDQRRQELPERRRQRLSSLLRYREGR